MATKFYIHLSSLITQARLGKGFSTLKELYREKNPSLDYQTWLSAESGRRIPSANAVIMIGDILEIDREALIFAYCKDKFDDPKSSAMFESLQHRNFISMDTLLEAKDHDRSTDYVFSPEQLIAMKKDPRLKLYLTYTYDRNLVTTFDRLMRFFRSTRDEVNDLVQTLENLGLVRIRGDEIQKIHLHSTLPDTADLFDLRRKILLESLDLTLKSSGYLTNYFVDLTEESFKRLCAFFDFVGANLIKMSKEDKEKLNTFRVQVTLTTSKLNDGSNDNGTT